MKKNSDWKYLVRNITEEMKKLNQEEKQIKKMNKREYEKLGITPKDNPLEELEEYEEVISSFPMYTDALNSRKSRLRQIQKRKKELEKQLLSIKCVALFKSKKLNKKAEQKGFIDNRTYAESLLKQHGVSYDEAIEFLEDYFRDENFDKKEYFGFGEFEMDQSEARFINRRL